ncbi:hypothetical protein GCK32_013727, partial [Trichostrongylus colubriformis]
SLVAILVEIGQTIEVEKIHTKVTNEEYHSFTLSSIDPVRCLYLNRSITPRWDVYMRDTNTLTVYVTHNTVGYYQCYGRKNETANIMYEIAVFPKEFSPEGRYGDCSNITEDKSDGRTLPYDCNITHPSIHTTEVLCKICYTPESGYTIAVVDLYRRTGFQRTLPPYVSGSSASYMVGKIYR